MSKALGKEGVQVSGGTLPEVGFIGRDVLRARGTVLSVRRCGVENLEGARECERLFFDRSLGLSCCTFRLRVTLPSQRAEMVKYPYFYDKSFGRGLDAPIMCRPWLVGMGKIRSKGRT